MGCTSSRAKSLSRENLTTFDNTPWKLLHTTSLTEWSNVDHKLGFQASVDFTDKKCRLQPWCMAGGYFDVLLPAPVDQEDLDVAYVYDELLVLSETPWINQRVKLKHNYKNRVSHKKQNTGLQNAQLIGYRDNLAVVQVVRCDSKNEFLILDLDQGKVKGSHVEFFGDQPYLYECYISPDGTRILFKPNLLYSLKYRVQQVDDVLKVLSPAKQNRVYCVAQELFRDAAMDLILAFDPRYKHTRVAVANIQRRNQHVLCIYCLKSQKMLKKSSGPQYQRVQNLSFSPDGEFLATLLVTYSVGPNLYPQKYNFIATKIYDANTLQLLHQIQSFGTSAVSSLIPGAIFPIFSRLGEMLALGSGTGSCINQVDIFGMPPVLKLKHLCRQQIKTYLSDEEIVMLPVSEALRDYLTYRPLED